MFRAYVPPHRMGWKDRLLAFGALALVLLLVGAYLGGIARGVKEVVDENSYGTWEISVDERDANAVEVRVSVTHHEPLVQGGGAWVHSSDNLWTMPIEVVVGNAAAAENRNRDPDVGVFYLDPDRISSTRRGLHVVKVLDARAEQWKRGERWTELRRGGKTLSEGVHMDLYGYRVVMTLLCTQQ